MEETPLLGCRQNGDRVVRAGGAEIGSLERVYRNVDDGYFLVFRVTANLLPDEQHGSLVPLALADHDRSVHRNRLHSRPHGFRRNVIGVAAIPCAHGMSAGYGCSFDNRDELRSQVMLHAFFLFRFGSDPIAHSSRRHQTR
jgi:hypothetical protein